MNPFEIAVLIHTKFVTIHSFVDGNGRMLGDIPDRMQKEEGRTFPEMEKLVGEFLDMKSG